MIKFIYNFHQNTNYENLKINSNYLRNYSVE